MDDSARAGAPLPYVTCNVVKGMVEPDCRTPRMAMDGSGICSSIYQIMADYYA